MKKIILFLVFFTSNAVAWELITDKDDFKGTVSHGLVSESVKPNRPLAFPYNNPDVRLFFICENKNFVLFNTASNLQDGDLRDGYDGYNIHTVDVKMNGNFYTLELYQPWNSDGFVLLDTDTKKVLNYATKEFVIQLNHYSDGLRHYTFDMTGFDKNMCP